MRKTHLGRSWSKRFRLAGLLLPIFTGVCDIMIRVISHTCLRRSFDPSKRLVELTPDELDAKLTWHANNLTRTGELLDLANHKLRGFDLSGKPLRQVALVGSDLVGANLGSADFSGSNLTGADLRGADCTGAVFDRTCLHCTKLQAAILRNADLSQSIALTPHQLRGSDLTEAILPDGIADAGRTASAVAEASTNSSLLVSATLLICLYCWITLFAISDFELIRGSSVIGLPVLRRSVPAATFFLLAPAFIFLTYLWMHSSLQNLWDALASLPARFPDGSVPREQKYSATISGFVRAYLPLIQGQGPSIERFRRFITRVLVWWAVPLTLVGFWLRFLVRRDPSISYFHAFLLTLSVFYAQWLWHVARMTLETGGVAERGRMRRLGKPRAFSRLSFTGLTMFIVILTTSVSVSPRSVDRTESWSTLLPSALGSTSWRTYFNVDGMDLSQKPSSWDGNDLSLVRGGGFLSRNLGCVSAAQVFAVKADFRRAYLGGANLTASDLRHAQFDGANLMSAVLTAADLRGASFQNANLQRAVLAKANLQGAFIQGVDFRSVDLKESYNWVLMLGNAEDYSRLGLPKDHRLRLVRKDLTDYDFRKLPAETKLNQADLSDFCFRLARLNGVSFNGARLARADFRGTDLDGATFQDADLEKADLRGVDLTHVEGLTVGQIRGANTDNRTKFPPHIQAQLDIPLR